MYRLLDDSVHAVYRGLAVQVWPPGSRQHTDEADQLLVNTHPWLVQHTRQQKAPAIRQVIHSALPKPAQVQLYPSHPASLIHDALKLILAQQVCLFR